MKRCLLQLAAFLICWPLAAQQSQTIAAMRHRVAAAPTITFVGGQSACGNSLTAGDLADVSVQWTGSGITVTSVKDGAGNSLTAATEYSDGVNDHIQSYYTLSVPTTTYTTYTVTYSGSTSQQYCVLNSAHKSSGTWSLDTETGGGTDTTTSLSIGPMTTSGTPGIVFFSYQNTNSAPTFSNPLINGVTPSDAYGTTNYFYRILTSPFTSGTCNGTFSANTDWVSDCIAFK